MLELLIALLSPIIAGLVEGALLTLAAYFI